MNAFIDPVRLVTALTNQANDFAAKTKEATSIEGVGINSTVSMLLYAISIAVADATVVSAGPRPLDEVLGADENVGSFQG